MFTRHKSVMLISEDYLLTCKYHKLVCPKKYMEKSHWLFRRGNKCSANFLRWPTKIRHRCSTIGLWDYYSAVLLELEHNLAAFNVIADLQILLR